MVHLFFALQETLITKRKENKCSIPLQIQIENKKKNKLRGEKKRPRNEKQNRLWKKKFQKTEAKIFSSDKTFPLFFFFFPFFSLKY